MKFRSPIPRNEYEWHDWFAWFPVHVGQNDVRWLEWVQRKKTMAAHFMSPDKIEYRAMIGG
jgi:hypothetical protein